MRGKQGAGDILLKVVTIVKRKLSKDGNFPYFRMARVEVRGNKGRGHPFFKVVTMVKESSSKKGIPYDFCIYSTRDIVLRSKLTVFFTGWTFVLSWSLMFYVFSSLKSFAEKINETGILLCSGATLILGMEQYYLGKSFFFVFFFSNIQIV